MTRGLDPTGSSMSGCRCSGHPAMHRPGHAALKKIRHKCADVIYQINDQLLMTTISK